MPTVSQGIRGTGILATEDRAARDVVPSLLQLEPDAGPLTQVLMKIGSKPAKNAKFEWYEDELQPRFDKLGAAITSTSATSMTVTNYKRFRKGDLVKIANKETVRVTATPSSTTVSITRGVGDEAAATASNGAQLFIMSPAAEEGSTARDLASTQREGKYNYCQIVKTPFGVTGTQEGTDQLAGQDFNEERRKKLIEHKRDIEHMLLFGVRDKYDGDTHPIRMSGGITYFVTTNVKDMGGDMTEPEWEDFLRICFRYGSKEKLVLCSPKAITAINGFARGRLITKSDESTYGVTMTQYQNAGRKVMLVEHQLLTNDDLSDFTGVAGYCIVVDVKGLTLRYMRGTMVGYSQNIQANDADERKDQYLSELGLELDQERDHGIGSGIEG